MMMIKLYYMKEENLEDQQHPQKHQHQNQQHPDQ
jgi:hypothetical protein